jgi:outer membrane protein TolC
MTENYHCEMEMVVAIGTPVFRFDEGDMDLFDLLSVEQRTFDRRVELTSVQRALLDQRVNLYLSLGGSWK